MLKRLLFVGILLCSVTFANEIIKIGIEGSYPPFSYLASDKSIQGFEPDLAHLFCEKMNRKCEIIQIDFDALIPSLRTKRIDVILASMSITDDRKKMVDFSNKYYQTPARFIAPIGSKIEINENGLQKKYIGVQSGTIHEIFINDNYKKSANVRSYRSLDEAMFDLDSGRIDVVFADTVAADDGYLQKDYGKRLAFIGPDFTDKKWFGEGVGAGFRKGDKALVELFNDAIKASRKDHSYQDVAKKYFSIDVFGQED